MTSKLSDVAIIRDEARKFAPPAFDRHRALPDPMAVDSRGEETRECVCQKRQ